MVVIISYLSRNIAEKSSLRRSGEKSGSITYAPALPRIGLPSLDELALKGLGIASKTLGVFGGVILDMLLNLTPTSDEDWDPDGQTYYMDGPISEYPQIIFIIPLFQHHQPISRPR